MNDQGGSGHAESGVVADGQNKLFPELLPILVVG